MAVDLASVSGTKKQSIARVELFTDASPAPDDWRMVFHFEDGFYDGAGKLIGATDFGTRRVERRFGDVKDVTLSAAGSTATVAQLAALVSKGAYAFREEDIARSAVLQGAPAT